MVKQRSLKPQNSVQYRSNPPFMIQTRYRMKIGRRMYDAGCTVRQATIDEMRKVWPGISVNQDSNQIGVWFEGLDVPTIVSKNSLVLPR